MRKRNVQILFRLNETEAEQLDKLVQRSGRTRESFLRSMVQGYQLCEKPDAQFYHMMQELAHICAQLEQLQQINITAEIVQAERSEWQRFRLAVSRAYLLPKRVQ